MIKQRTDKSKDNKEKRVNWKEYNKALVQRGSLEIWIDKDIASKGWYAKPTGKIGSQPKYTDSCIEMILTIGKVFNQRLRQTEGLVTSLVKLLNIDVEIPDYTTLSRRGGKLQIDLKVRDKQKVYMIVDGSGLKVYGEGEWKVRKHGVSKRRTWMKMHLGVDEDNEIRVCVLTDNSKTDADKVDTLIAQEVADIKAFIGDGGYDKRKVYDKCKERGISDIRIPPRKNAKIMRHGNKRGPPHPRDENLREIRKTTKKKWKISNGYHKRSLSETAMYRAKVIFGDRLHARKFETQNAEFMVMCNALNKMAQLGLPGTL